MTVIPTQGAFVDEDAAVVLARYFNIGPGASRILYLRGGASDVVEVEIT
jgi:hypothetical protein